MHTIKSQIKTKWVKPVMDTFFSFNFCRLRRCVSSCLVSHLYCGRIFLILLLTQNHRWYRPVDFMGLAKIPHIPFREQQWELQSPWVPSPASPRSRRASHWCTPRGARSAGCNCGWSCRTQSAPVWRQWSPWRWCSQPQTRPRVRGRCRCTCRWKILLRSSGSPSFCWHRLPENHKILSFSFIFSNGYKILIRNG